MRLTHVGRKAFGYGVRHLAQQAGYHLGTGLAAPDRVLLTLTHRCNCSCVMCDLWKTRDHAGELPTERWIAILEELHGWIGTFRVVITGGEVFLKPGVYDLLKRAVDLGLTVDVGSNGLVFRSEHHFRNLMECGLRSISFSLDGVDPEVHDRHRGFQGTHETVSGVIRRIKREKPSMSVTVMCIIMKETAPQLEAFARWAKDLGVDNVLFQPVTQNVGSQVRRDDWYDQSQLFVRDLETLHRSVEGLARLKAESNVVEVSTATLERMEEFFARPEEVQMKGRRCLLGQTNLRINPTGTLYLCDVRNTTIGHADDGPLRKTWTSPRANEVRRQIKRCERPCVSFCNRSPGLLEKARTFVRYARIGRL